MPLLPARSALETLKKGGKGAILAKLGAEIVTE